MASHFDNMEVQAAYSCIFAMYKCIVLYAWLNLLVFLAA